MIFVWNTIGNSVRTSQKTVIGLIIIDYLNQKCYTYILTYIKIRARISEGRGVYRLLVEKLRERDHWVDPGVDGKIILRRIFKKWLWRFGLD
jgi:hypothetical protein